MWKEEYTQTDRGDSVQFMSNLVNKHKDLYISQTFACRKGHLEHIFCTGKYKFKLHLKKPQRFFVKV